MVEGTPGPDQVRILPTPLPGTVRVVFDGKTLGSFGPVANIDVSAGAGNDSVIVDPRITLPTVLDGGPGNDRLQGGSGPNVLLGGPGHNTLIGNPSRDTLNGGPGKDSVVAVKSLGVVQVGPSATGAALRGLSGSYTLMPLQVAGPAVVGAADLRNGRIANQLKNDYAGGQPVALTNATPDTAAALASMLGDPAPVAFPAGVSQVELVTFRKINQGGRTMFSTSILPPMVHVSVASADREAGLRLDAQGVRTYLQGVFTATPAVPAQPKVGGPVQDLLAIANSYSITNLYHDDSGAQLQLTDTIYNVRSFLNAADYYYVSQELIARQGTNKFTYLDTYNNVPDTTLSRSPIILQPSPQSNPPATTYSSSVSFSIGGSVGFNQAQGFNASVNASVSVSNSTTVTVPPIQIFNLANLVTGDTQWEYAFSTPPQPTVTTALYDQWIWEVPFGAYPPPPSTSPLTIISQATYSTATDPDHGQGAAWNVTVPRPFGDTFELQAPQVFSVSEQTVNPGDTFTIEGSGLYPALVQAVLIGGQPLSQYNFTTVNDNQIQVVAPNTPGNALLVVVKTTQGYSTGIVPINITGPSLVHVQAFSFNALADQAFFEQPLASFTYVDPTAPTTDFTAAITWGDNATSFGIITSNGQGNYEVLGSHSYFFAGTYPFGVQVTDLTGSKGTSGGITTVTGTAMPQPLFGVPVSAVAGQAFTNQPVATLTLSDPNANPTDFTAMIDWSDGKASAGTVTAAGPGKFDVTGSHTYATAGIYPFGVEVISGANVYTTTGRATVSTSTGGPQNLVTIPISPVPGQAFTNQTVATFTDSAPNAKPTDFSSTINWGDGNTSDGTITAAGPGAFDVLGTHTYTTAGNYAFSIQVTDSAGNKPTASGTATVSSGPQHLETEPVTTAVNQPFTNQLLATFTDSDPNVIPPDFTATINWGDGLQNITTVTAAGSGAFDVLGTHTYTAAGKYTFSVQVADTKSPERNKFYNLWCGAVATGSIV
jgi:hypothetical protein